MAAKRGGRTQAKRGGGIKMVAVLALGLVIGLGLAAAYLLYGDRERLDALLPQPDPQAEAAPSSREREPVAQEPASPPRPTFDFYTVLPEKEVALPGEATQGAAASGANASAPPPPDNGTAGTPPVATTAAPPAPAGGLQLQAGAFSNAGDAEALRAKLALLGRSARIEAVQADGRTLHRVRLGPFATEAERAAAQAQLAEAGIGTTPAR